MQLLLLSTAILATLETVSAHASIKYPKPINFDTDTSYNAPLKPDYSNFPCKGYHTQAFESAATWKAGEDAYFVIRTNHSEGQGIAPHGGGSCQASISHDGGQTFRVLQSWIGDCPRNVVGSDALGDPQFNFTIPPEEPAGEAIFAWTWFAAIANREMYMDCSFVTIENENPQPNSEAITKRPYMFVGFLAAGVCAVSEGNNLAFPSPGPSPVMGYMTAPIKPTATPHNSDNSPCAMPTVSEFGGGEAIPDSVRVPANTALAAAGGNSGSGGAKPAPLAPTPSSPMMTSSMMTSSMMASSPMMASSTMMASSEMPVPTDVANPNAPSTILVISTETTLLTSTTTDVDTVTTPAAANVVYVTEVVTQSVYDMVTVTATDYVPAPTGGAKKEKRESCDFQTTLKVGGKCNVPNTQASTWPDCVWKEFCGCLNQNLSPNDLMNFSIVKGHCDCVTMGVGCSTTTRSRRRRRNVSAGGKVDIVLRRSGGKVRSFFRA
ncbi:hypothetical protein TWF694_011332 [Orbilia ellipsospora]|uniref:Lytic polysaccharide monooxygenase n=1 Tax=Orbilia ellipsospora TaxID=2528407 RepID=A0AAV9X7I9_9PEZI